MTHSDRHLHHEHHDTDQPTTTPADRDEQQSNWPTTGWQWASLVAVLLAGQAVLWC